MKNETTADLRHLARLYGFQTAYTDVFGRRRAADREVLEMLLASRGVHFGGPSGVGDAIEDRIRADAKRLAEPVVVVRSGNACMLPLHVPRAATHVDIRIEAEQERTIETKLALASRRIEGDFAHCGVDAVVRRIPLGRLAAGYHRLFTRVGNETAESLVIAAPRKAFGDPRGASGFFAPIYALRSKNDYGIGDFGSADEFLDWAMARGGSVFATLPLHPAFCDEPFDPSPYSPVSRLFLNELLIDIDAARGHGGGLNARAASERAQLKAASLIDYRRVGALKMSMLESIASELAPAGRDALAAYIAKNPEVLDYARFRAMTDARRAPWSTWPDATGENEVDTRRVATYACGQWIADRQLGALASKARSGGIGLYLDFPLGSSPDGYDVWKYRGLFLPRVSAGAPPDHSYGSGQNWGFRPLDPDVLRESGYDYFIRAIRTQLRYAGMLRIDHVMSLHRLYCVPEGTESSHGAYMRYRAEELYAILKVESHRAGSIIVGEDLGTVPRYVREAIDEHGFKRLFVLQRQLSHVKENPPGAIVGNMLASINNHDIPTFASYWRGIDLADRTDIGIYDAAVFAREVAKRRDVRARWIAVLVGQGLLREEDRGDVAAIMRASSEYLGRSDAAIVLLNVEDLWLETAPQNTPTTTWQRSNWRRRFRFTMAEIAGMVESTWRQRRS